MPIPISCFYLTLSTVPSLRQFDSCLFCITFHYFLLTPLPLVVFTWHFPPSHPHATTGKLFLPDTFHRPIPTPLLVSCFYLILATVPSAINRMPEKFFFPSISDGSVAFQVKQNFENFYVFIDQGTRVAKTNFNVRMDNASINFESVTVTALVLTGLMRRSVSAWPVNSFVQMAHVLTSLCFVTEKRIVQMERMSPVAVSRMK